MKQIAKGLGNLDEKEAEGYCSFALEVERR